MSSVDLHTHASFQCMLPESFAVVCAPKSDPRCVFLAPSLLEHHPWKSLAQSLLLVLVLIQNGSLITSPSFGIFRLTDPPGLQTVLKCTAKQAFHPHPDVPIYTVRVCVFVRPIADTMAVAVAGCRQRARTDARCGAGDCGSAVDHRSLERLFWVWAL
jgi:hypothetical protein